MRGTQQINPSIKAGIFPALFVCVSLLLNVFLAAHLLNRKSAAPTAATTADDSKPAGTQSPSAARATSETPAIAASDVSQFHWSEIESADYRQYIANLRAAGCPAQVIRDIIVADLSQHFTKRAREIWPMRVREYWKKSVNENPDPKPMEQLAALGKEHGAMLKDLLGVRTGQQELIDTLHLQVHGSERELLFLPADRREAAMRALDDGDFESRETKLQSQGNYRTQQQMLFDEKLKSLADVLTPEELDEFHQRNSPVGAQMKSEVRYLSLSQEEYRQLLLAKESGGGVLSTREAVQKLYGEERAKEFERVSSAFYINARTGAEAEGIPLTQVDQAARLADDSLKQGLAAARDKTLPVAERKARLQELQSQAEARITELLGDKASRLVLRDLRNGLHNSAVNIQP